MIEIWTAVKDRFVQAFLDSFLGQELTHLFADLDFRFLLSGALLDLRGKTRDRYQRASLVVIDELGIDISQAAIDTQARTISGAVNFSPDSPFPPLLSLLNPFSTSLPHLQNAPTG
jgi:hypothetical protein